MLLLIKLTDNTRLRQNILTRDAYFLLTYAALTIAEGNVKGKCPGK
jgi:hypothetical protein